MLHNRAIGRTVSCGLREVIICEFLVLVLVHVQRYADSDKCIELQTSGATGGDNLLAVVLIPSGAIKEVRTFAASLTPGIHFVSPLMFGTWLHPFPSWLIQENPGASGLSKMLVSSTI